MELIILQPDSESISVEDIQSLNVLTIDGEITILPNHISIITALDIGLANVKSSVNASVFRIMRLVRLTKILRVARVPMTADLVMMVNGHPYVSKVADLGQPLKPKYFP